MVEKAKLDVLDLLQNGRAFSYAVLAQILADTNLLKRLIEELERHHLIVTGVPLPLPIANAEAGPSTRQPPLTEAGVPPPLPIANAEAGPSTRQLPESVTTGSGEASVDSGKVIQCVRDVKYSNPVRQSMLQKGLYKKHDVRHPLLDRFARYLNRVLLIENYKQEVDNVARYLYYADPHTPSLQFVNDRENIRQYLRDLSEAKLKKQTQQNYLKS